MSPLCSHVCACNPVYSRQEPICFPSHVRGYRFTGDDPDHDPPHDNRPLAREVAQAAHHVPAEILQALDASRQPITRDQIIKAHGESWAHMAQPLVERVNFHAVSEEAFLQFLPYVPARQCRYDDDHECGDFATDAKAFCVACGRFVSGKTLDTKGGHSFCVTPVFRGIKPAVVHWEPQTGQVIPHADPRRHYTGVGLWLYG